MTRCPLCIYDRPGTVSWVNIMFGRTYEGMIINGQIRFSEQVQLPDRSRVLVIVPEEDQPRTCHVYTPRLAQPEEAKDFAMEVEEVRDARV